MPIQPIVMAMDDPIWIQKIPQHQQEQDKIILVNQSSQAWEMQIFTQLHYYKI